MSAIVLGVGEYGATNKSGEAVKTFALGSCVAVILLEPKTRTVGMVHVALPDSKIDANRAKERPGYFADTGLPALIELMGAAGCTRNGKGMIVKLVGGANVMDTSNTFNIGKRNVIALKKLLWQRGMGALAEDIGGHISRTVTVEVDTGKVLITSSGRDGWEI